MTDESTGSGGLRSTMGRGGDQTAPPDGSQTASPPEADQAGWPSPDQGPWESVLPQHQPGGHQNFGGPNRTFDSPNQTFGSGPAMLAPPPPDPGSVRPKWHLALVVVVLLAGAGAFFVLRGGDGGSRVGGQASGLTSLLGRGPEGRLEEQWSQRVDAYPYSVAIHDGTVFVADGDDDRVTVRALDLGGDGTERWAERFGGYEAWLRVHSGLLLISADEEVTAVDPRSGEESWSKNGYWTGLDLADLVIVTDDDEAVAYELNGDRRWRTRGNAIGACDGTVLVSSNDSVVAVLARDGSESWEADGNFVACGDGAAFVQDDDRVRVIDLVSGDERWNARVSGYATALAHDGTVVVKDEDSTVGYRVSNGDELWSADVDEVGRPVGVSGTTVITFGDGSLRKIDPASGEEVERARVSSSSGGAFVGENIVLVVEEYVFAAYSLDNLDELWDVDVDGYHQSWAIEDGWLVLTEDDEVVAYR